jgi:hypothetical protein
MIPIYISLYMVVGVMMLLLVTLAGKVNWLDIHTWELKLFVAIIFMVFWWFFAPIVFFGKKRNFGKTVKQTPQNKAN